jgi:hypothetical protein
LQMCFQYAIYNHKVDLQTHLLDLKEIRGGEELFVRPDQVVQKLLTHDVIAKKYARVGGN